MKIGIGYDLHRLVEGRRLFIGGIEIPYLKGLDGHSDADVLLHAICDSLLGAIGEVDIGSISLIPILNIVAYPVELLKIV